MSIDIQNRIKLFRLASTFSKVLHKCKWFEFGKKRKCEDAIFNIYLALRD